MPPHVFSGVLCGRLRRRPDLGLGRGEEEVEPDNCQPGEDQEDGQRDHGTLLIRNGQVESAQGKGGRRGRRGEGLLPVTLRM